MSYMNKVAKMSPDDLIPSSSEFDFVRKLQAYPDKIDAVRKFDAIRAISTVYLDVNTDSCNQRCFFCDGLYRDLKTSRFETPRLLQLVDEMEELQIKALVLAGDRGEPFMHPGFDQLLERLRNSNISFGIYTNGVLIEERFVEALRTSTFVRISADAATSETYEKVHLHRGKKNGFERLLSVVRLLAGRIPSLGISFILTKENVSEMSNAADLFLGLGADSIEFKPYYMPEYQIDQNWYDEMAATIDWQARAAKKKWGNKVKINNQVNTDLSGQLRVPSLTVPSRPCLTHLLRMVISTHGCYTCTPYRGEPGKKVGDIRMQTLREVVCSIQRLNRTGEMCSRRCAYHEQNNYLIENQDCISSPLEIASLQPARGQACFI